MKTYTRGQDKQSKIGEIGGRVARMLGTVSHVNSLRINMATIGHVQLSPTFLQPFLRFLQPRITCPALQCMFSSFIHHFHFHSSFSGVFSHSYRCLVEPFIWKGLPLPFPPGSVLAGDLSYRATAGLLEHIFFQVPKLAKFQQMAAVGADNQV